jgi:hypothetical protein
LSVHPPTLRAYRPVEIDGLIRVGRDNDGGYVVPAHAIDTSHSLLSLGVNDDWSFEEAVLARNPAILITCVDATTGMARILLKTAQKAFDLLGNLLTFRIAKLRRNCAYLAKPFLFHRFFSRHPLLPLMVASRDAPGEVTLSTLLERVTAGRKDRWVILKSDIEGAEFDVLADSSGRLTQVSLLAIEFHRLDLNWERFAACMKALMRDFHVAHMHGNNFDGYVPGTGVPITLEVTLINKALVKGSPLPSRHTYPIPDRDMCNTPKRVEIQIDFE